MNGKVRGTALCDKRTRKYNNLQENVKIERKIKCCRIILLLAGINNRSGRKLMQLSKIVGGHE